MLYTIAVTFTLLGSLFCLSYALVQLVYEIKFGQKAGPRRVAGHLNSMFSGRKALMWLFASFIIVALFSWLAIALPLIDFYVNLHWITSYDSYPSVLHTYFGDFVDKNKDGERLMIFVMLGIPVAKGYWFLLDIAKLLRNGYIVTDGGGRMMQAEKFRS